MLLHFGCLEYQLGSLSYCTFSISSSPAFGGLDWPDSYGSCKQQDLSREERTYVVSKA